MSKIKALIFDLDGTVADTIHAIREALNMMLRELDCPPISHEHLLVYFNNSAKEYARNSLPEDRRDEKTVAIADRLFDEKYALTYTHTDKCYDGIPEALEELKNHYRLGMLSNKQDAFVEVMVKNLFRDGLFETAHGVRPIYPAKPAPDAAIAMARDLGAEPHECIFVGDSDVDVKTAKNAGMIALDVTWGYRDEETLRALGADHIVHTPAEMVEKLISLKG